MRDLRFSISEALPKAVIGRRCHIPMRVMRLISTVHWRRATAAWSTNRLLSWNPAHSTRLLGFRKMSRIRDFVGLLRLVRLVWTTFWVSTYKIDPTW